MSITLNNRLGDRVARLAADRGYTSAEAVLEEALDMLEAGGDDAVRIGALIAEADAEDDWLTPEEANATLDESMSEIRTKLGL